MYVYHLRKNTNHITVETKAIKYSNKVPNNLCISLIHTGVDIGEVASRPQTLILYVFSCSHLYQTVLQAEATQISLKNDYFWIKT